MEEKILKLVEELTERVSALERTNIKFAKTNPNAILPSKRQEDAGFDMYACFEEDVYLIKPGETVLVPTGIATAFSDKFMFRLAERGSTGTKGIAQRCGIIDSGFRGEIKAPITNVGKYPLVIAKENIPDKVRVYTKSGEIEYSKEFYNESLIKENCIVYPYEKAITQGILLYLPEVSTTEISYDELKEIPSERGTGMLGSSTK